jgi:uncharacterized repeat protein (TIGR01451 family)
MRRFGDISTIFSVAFLTFSSAAFAQSADLSVTKSGSPNPAIAGSTITYTIMLANGGPDTASNVALTDTLSPDTTFVSMTQDTGPAFSLMTPPVGGTGTVTATAATFASGASAQFTLVVKINASRPLGFVSNTATVTSTTADPNAADNTATTFTEVVTMANLSVTKTDSPDPVMAGTNLTYALTVTNSGPSDAQNVVLSDNTPANTTFVSMMQTSGPAFTITTPVVGGTGTVTASIVTLAAGATATFTLVVNVNASTPNGATITNTATAVTTTNDPNLTNNSATQTTTVNTSADLVVTKTDAPDPVNAGSNITYTLTLTNNGPSDAQTVSLADGVPAGTTFVSMMQTSGPAFTLTTPPVGGTGTVTASIVTFAAGASATFSMVVNVNAATTGIISNTANASSATVDSNPANNTATAQTTVNTADLAVTKSDTPDPVNAGTNLNYTLTLTNNGANFASNVVLSDAIPANTTFVSMMQTSGPAFTLTTPPVGGSGTVTATAVTFAAGASATFTLVVNVNASTPNGATITNTVTVSSTTPDPVPGNNSAMQTTAVNAVADLAVTKTDIPDPVNGGSNITYALTLTNNGLSDAQTVSLTDVVPANTTFVSMMQTSGPAFTLTTPAVGGTGTATANIATFASGATATFTLVVNVNAAATGTITNTATVTSTTSDSNPANNTATATTTVSGADLAITKSAGAGPFAAGGNVNYTITVTNNGPSTATGVTVVDTLPAGSTFVSSTPSQGSCSGTGPVTCNLGTLTNGGTATIALVVTTSTTPGMVTNTATVSSAVSDPNPANNTATSTVTTFAFIPTLSEWMLLLLALSLGGIGFMLMRE